MNLKDIVLQNKDFIKGEYHTYFSPGRVNLIGEHIDYLGGKVFPSAISLGTYAFIVKREDKKFRMLSQNFKNKGVKEFTIDNLEYKESDNWTNYAKGMVKALIDLGHDIKHGFDILVYGTLPNSSGLSSSASLEVLIGTILNTEFNLKIEMFDLVQIAQKVENNYMGVNCGIMDQFAVGMSLDSTAIYLDTNNLEYSYVPLVLGDYSLVIANTNKKRALADSKYNERRSECDKGLLYLQDGGVRINELCDMTSQDLEKHINLIPEQLIKNRVVHAVNENERVVKAVEALKENDLITFGEMMNQSHDSLKDLYEVSCIELDTLVDSFRKNGAIGSRMTGAGFGGCTVSLVKTSEVEECIKNVKADYLNSIGYNADFYPVKTSDGAKKIESGE